MSVQALFLLLDVVPDRGMSMQELPCGGNGQIQENVLGFSLTARKLHQDVAIKNIQRLGAISGLGVFGNVGVFYR